MFKPLKHAQYLKSFEIEEIIPDEKAYINTITLKVVTKKITFKNQDDKSNWILINIDSVKSYKQTRSEELKKIRIDEIKARKLEEKNKITETTETKTE